ncbi:hypothetical protein B0H17DRAFT_426482 [Mycena rosella]|uniref:Uncharacterized protein n=1 Tax=Mycena rosella TaxID=1033263 RepID=A0AAD7GI13_MYCRO|nr:hypothetical protein B0H17DRAFT_426482 [Mycena rosella]
MADGVPDEIWAEILGPALRVSDAAFSDTSEDIFMSFAESSSALLLVSKAWLRVATPLLYNVVVLRSKAQAQALAATLKSNPDLGRFIKKLRVEGGFAISMHKILQTSTNITHLFLSLNIVSDNACGLCRGLPLIDPGHVILHSPRHYGLSVAAYKLLETVEKCITTWKTLAVVDIPNALAIGAMLSLAEALSKAPNLTALVISDPHRNISAIPSYVREIASNPSLKCIRLKPPLSLGRRLIDAVVKDPKMKALFELPNDRDLSMEKDVPLPSGSVRPVQLSADMVLDDSIWSRVLYFALYRTARVRYWYHQNKPPSTYLAPLLVSKTFARLGIPHLYERPFLETPFVVGSFASQLAENPPLRQHVRYLTIAHSGDLAVFKSIISHTPALVELNGGHNCSPVTWKAFNDLGGFTGSTLLSFQAIPISKASEAVNTAVFSRFSQLRSFWWSSRTVFKTAPKLIPANTFDNLVDLTVNNCDASFLAVLSHMELPSLRTTTFSAVTAGGKSFFQKHGYKLQELTVSISQIGSADVAIFNNCPSLTFLGISCDDKTFLNLSGLKASDTHARLERIVFKLPSYRMKQNQRGSCGRFLLSLDGKAFPALREIEHPHCSWPTTDPEISKSHFVRWAEALQDHNIQLVGKTGVQWRRRLKYMPKKTAKNA